MAAIPALNLAWRRVLVLIAAVVVALSISFWFFPQPLPTSVSSKWNDHWNSKSGGSSTSSSSAAKESSSSSSSSSSSTSASTKPVDNNDWEQLIHALWKPIVVPVDQKSYLNKDGETYTLKVDPIFTKPQGKKICILDVDTRPLDGEGELFNKEEPSWQNLHHLSGGILAHHLYALIHGYDYKFIRAPNYSDRQGGWTKVIMTMEMMKTHDIVLMIDSDAVLRNPELPLEWLMNYWNITSEVSIAMAADPAGDPNFDSKGNVMLNTGFNINQAKAPKTDELYKVWAECPEETVFKGCGRWKYEWFREQIAFSEHVRYNYEEGNVIKTLPCDEANGSPEQQQSGCSGRFLRHYWANKDKAKREFMDGVMQMMTPLLTKNLHNDFLDMTSKTLKGAEILD